LAKTESTKNITMKNLTLMALSSAAMVAASANANTITVQTPAGATTSGPVSASATFTTGAGILTISITDSQANPTDVAQLVSDISWGFGRNISSAGIGIVSAVGAGVNVAGNGTTTPGVVAGNAWAVDAGFHITALGGGQPTGLIIGPAGPGGLYSNANGSIAANGPHNPFYNGTATFTLNIPGLTAADVVNGIQFSFGTTPGLNIPGTSVPDGGTTVLLLGAALSGLGLIRRKLS
jgi:hypothetical protein